MLRWLAHEFGYGPAAAGLLTSGGSLSQLAAMVTARHARFGDVGGARGRARVHLDAGPPQRRQGRCAWPATRSDSAAHGRGGRAAAHGPATALAAAVRRDRDAGLQPFLVVAAAGTTNTGAIDPLPAIADVCARARPVAPRGRRVRRRVRAVPARDARRCAGIERADSITFDPHKGMFLPYGTGALLVRDGAALRRAHQRRGGLPAGPRAERRRAPT